MLQSYHITGMTCQSCVKTVQENLINLPGIQTVEIDLTKGKVDIDASAQINTEQIQDALAGYDKYTLRETISEPIGEPAEIHSDSKSLYPLYLVFAYLIGIVGLTQIITGAWIPEKAIRYFMGGFFLFFSFFKMLNIQGFADAFSSYDPLAKKWKVYGYLYPFMEVLLGILFLTGIGFLWTNLFTLVLLTIGTIGVIQSLLHKRTIQCACLGTIFNLPMTKVTLIENTLMIGMSAYMLAQITSKQLLL